MEIETVPHVHFHYNQIQNGPSCLEIILTNGHCSTLLLSDKVVIGCAEPSGSSLQLDDVFLLQALPCQRMPHVLPDDLVHTFLRHLKVFTSLTRSTPHIDRDPNSRRDITVAIEMLTTSPVGLSTHATVEL